ncbi:NAD(P)/FAD-dependent oxidoreductase [Roseivirga pacifica]|uniref:NAD(P)/FAD-dependent oxidoreductase n=1 Tax=Roseivirga pacifica TaxID=1267423 RepID=UPI00227A2467|nr:NAD(P)/FAD-dependent oxidoreductase [Roseivirga pacifica]
MSNLKVAVIGGGAAGFFAAISAKSHHPKAQVQIFEKTSKLLAKVKVSGGGRCNVTHACPKPAELIKFYPRGSKKLRKVFDQFSVNDTIDWYESRGVELKTEADNRMFPVTDSSQTIIDCLMAESKRLGIQTNLNTAIRQIEKTDTGFSLDGTFFNKVIVATGGSPKLAGFEWLQKLGHTIESPVPSLFTFNMPKEPVKALMGVSVPNATVKVLGTKLVQSDPLLITHWGMSGPAILKTSAWGARELAENNYHFTAQINWLADKKEEALREELSHFITENGKRQIKNKNPFGLPQRLWDFLLEKVEISAIKPWMELGKKDKNRLVNVLINDQYQVAGKTTFKEEFVTCGGVSLSQVDFKSMQSTVCPGLYFAGEVLDVDGVTGGFNFQAAWSTGFVAGRLL